MSEAKQLILSKELRMKAEHGGEVAKGRRKVARPIATRKSMHLVLRASEAVGKYSFLLPENARIVEKELKRCCRTYSVRVYEFANVGNHCTFWCALRLARDSEIFLESWRGE